MKEVVQPIPVRSFDVVMTQVKQIIGNEAYDLMERRLKSVYRWSHIPGVPEKFENDWDHYGEMFDNHDNLIANVPGTLRYINRTIVWGMMVGHDLPEPVVGDLSHQHPEYERLKPIYKAREDRAMEKMVGWFRYVNPSRMQAIYDLGIDPIDLYRRFEAHPPNDREALLAKYHDYEQAITKGLKFGLLERLNHGTNVKTVNLARMFTVSIPDTKLQQQLRGYFREQLSGLGKLTDSL